MTQRDYVKVYPDKSGGWRWVRIAANNERLYGSTESYDSKSYAKDQAMQFNDDVDDFRVEGDDDGAGVSAAPKPTKGDDGAEATPD